MIENTETSVETGIDLFKNLLIASWKALNGNVQDDDSFNNAIRKYIGGLINRFSSVKVLGMREPVPLKSLYVRANILEKITARAGLRPEELAEFFDFDRRTFGQKSETIDGEIIVNRLQKFIVLGKPGAGKTTYLKFLTLMMLDKSSRIEHRRLPVFVTLREWADEKISLDDFILKQFAICGFPQTWPFLEKMLLEGNCIVLFDGLDEVSQESNQDDIIRQIRNFTDKYAGNQFIISCRVAAYNHWFVLFTDVEMADFNEEQIETFIQNWFYGEPYLAAACGKQLKSNPQLRELAAVPLLLTLLCLEYSESKNFPPSRAELYERAIETLLGKWDESRQVYRSDIYKGLSTRRKESMFARIAYSTFSENLYFIRERTLAKMIEKYVEILPGYNSSSPQVDGRMILKSIEAQHGIFVERAKDVFSFAHLTFQEYFTAKYVVDNQVDDSLKDLVEKHLYDLKWKEVFLLVAGMLENSDELLLLMRRKANEVLDIKEINELFLEAKTSLLPGKSKYPEVLRRNAAILLFISLVSKRTLVTDLSGSLSNLLELEIDLAFAIARYLAVAKDLQNDLPQEQTLTHAADLAINIQILEAYGESVKHEKRTYYEIDNYYLANELILKCLESSYNVSEPIREKMLHEMFLSKEDIALRLGQ